MTKALVLGGGGVTGIAWELGVLHGLEKAGVPITGADTVIGTSAGSVVGTIITCGIDLGAAVAFQEAEAPPPRPQSAGGGSSLSRAQVAFALLADPAVPVLESRVKVGAFALAASTVDEERYLARMAAILPTRDWPGRDLRITAVDTADGRDVVFDAKSGVPLDRAVSASCSVPGLMPPVTIDGRRYMDGGVRLGAGADLAAGADRLVVLAPMAALDRERVRAEMASTGASRTLLIEPDQASIAAIGLNFMDQSRRAPAVRAGRQQGEALAEAVREVWES